MCTATIVNTSWSMCDNDRGGIEGEKGEGVIKLEGVTLLGRRDVKPIKFIFCWHSITRILEAWILNWRQGMLFFNS